jgi:hypothetical protein
MCVVIETAVIIATVVSTVATIISSSVSAAMQAENAQKQADAQARQSKIAAEQAASAATAQNLKDNLAARQSAVAANAESLAAAAQAALQMGENTTAGINSGVSGNYILDVTQALEFDADVTQGHIALQHQMKMDSAMLAGADTAQLKFNKDENLPPGGEIDLTGVVVGAVGSSIGAVGGAAGSLLSGPTKSTSDFTIKPVSGTVSVPSFSSGMGG